MFQLWWVVGAIVEALRDGGLETGVSIKRLLGLADREILQLYTQGEGRYAQNPPVELLNNLLYYAARATSNGPKVTAVRASFRLNELLNVDDTVEQERENLSAPSVKLMRTVAAAIREDLGKVKDVLDIYVRRGGAAGRTRARRSSMLRKIGDTLGVLGLGELRQLVLEETGRLEAMVAGKTPGGSRGAGAHRRHADQGRGPAGSRPHRPHRAEGAGGRPRRVGRRRIPAGAGRGAARVQREPGARQGRHRLECRAARSTPTRSTPGRT